MGLFTARGIQERRASGLSNLFSRRGFRSPLRLESLEERILFAVVSGHVDYNGPVQFTRVELFQWDVNDNQSSHWGYTDENGNYAITTPTTTGEMELVFELAWDPLQGAGGRDAPIFKVVYDNEDDAVEIDHDPVPFSATHNVDLTDGSWYMLDAVQDQHTLDLLESYDHLRQFLSFAYFGGFDGGTGEPANGAGIIGNLMAANPLTVHEWNRADFGGPGEPADGAYYFDFNIYMHDSIFDSGSFPDNFDTPMNNEWHESSHYIHELLLTEMPFDFVSINHAGYTNPNTTDSYEEGWAEFLPTEYLRLNNLTLRGLTANFYQYSGGDVDFSIPFLTWDDEEFAVASLLWKLTTHGPGEVGLDMEDLVDVLVNDKPENMGELYESLKDRGVGNTGSPLTLLDQAFVDGGFFADIDLRYDAKRDLFLDAAGKPTFDVPVYEEGDIIGYTANRNPFNKQDRIMRDGLGLPKLNIVSQPTKGWTKSAPFDPIVVEIQELDGNLISNANFPVSLKVLSGGGALLGTVTVNSVNGIATFNNFQFSAPGNIVVQAFCGNYHRDNSDAITVILPASKFVFKTLPAPTAAGTDFAPAIVVEARNSKNQVVVDYAADVTLSIKTGPVGGAIDGTLTVALVNGVATFAGLSTEKAGKYTLNATDGTLKGISAAFTVTPDSSTEHLAMLQPPTNTLVGKTVLPITKIRIEDQFGNVVTTRKGPAVLSVVSGPGIIKGVTTRTAGAGIFSFAGYSLTVAGAYQLRVTDSELNDPTPVDFNLTILPGTTVVKPPAVKAAGYLSSATTILTTKLTSNAPGTITFTGDATIEDDSNNVLATATTLANGTLKWTFVNPTPGTYLCTVIYDGDDSHTAVESTAFTLKFI
jgi:hypothetical protein